MTTTAAAVAVTIAVGGGGGHDGVMEVATAVVVKVVEMGVAATSDAASDGVRRSRPDEFLRTDLYVFWAGFWVVLASGACESVNLRKDKT